MNKYDLLAFLREGEYISGEILAEKFGVTRAAVWKSAAELRKEGYQIISRTNNGYKLLKSFDILNEYEIKSRLKNQDFDIIYKQVTGSTNDDAKKLESANNIIIAAGEQSAGRGRYGRSFSSKPGGLYFTLKICRETKFLNGNFFNIEGITFYPLIMAVAASQAVHDICGVNSGIKWPNDLLYKSGAGYKKLAGILTEASLHAENRVLSYIIAGIGLNVNTQEFDGEPAHTASSLKLITGQHYNRADLLCAIISNFTRLANSSRENLLGEYKKRLLTEVSISFAQNGREYTGVAQGIDDDGNLCAVLNDGQLIIIRSGEINFI